MTKNQDFTITFYEDTSPNGIESRSASKKLFKLCKQLHGRTIYFTLYKNTPSEVTFKSIILANPRISSKLSIKPLANPKYIMEKLNSKWERQFTIAEIENPTFCLAVIPFYLINTLSVLQKLLDGKRSLEELSSGLPSRVSFPFFPDPQCTY